MKRRENIIISSKVAKSYQSYLINQNENRQVFGVLTKPFAAVFYEGSGNTSYDKLVLYNKLIKRGDLPNYIKEASNFSSIHQFAKEILEYEIDYQLETFKDDAKALAILDAVSVLDLKKKEIKEEYSYIAQALSHSELSYLRKHNFKEIKLEENNYEPQVYHVESLNPIRELEHALYTIKTEALKNVILIVPNKDSYLSLIQYSSNKLGLSYKSNTSDYKLAKLVYVSLLDLYIAYKVETNDEKARLKFLDLFKSNIFSLNYAKEIYDYFAYYRVKIEENTIYIIDANEDINNKINEELETVLNKIKEIFKAHEKEVLEKIYHFTHEKYPYGSSKIKSYLQEVISLVNLDNLSFVLEEIKSQSVYHLESDYFEVLDYNSAPLYPQDNVFILGLNASTYPNIKGKRGLVNEALIEKLEHEDFSLLNRISHQESTKAQIFKSAKERLYVYKHELDLNGSNVDAPIIDQAILKDAISLNANLNYDLVKKEYRSLIPTINENHVKKYFLKNNVFSMSPSRMKQFIDDPVTYVKEKILNAYEVNNEFRNHLLFGNLNHKLLEDHYKHLNVDIDLYQDKLTYLYPNVSYADLIFALNKRIMTKFIANSDIELENSGFKVYPENVELDNLSSRVELTNNYLFDVYGRIDRFDEKDNELRVIDYKSSEQIKFSKKFKAVTKSEQYQLLSYMALIQEKYHNKQVTGAHFFDYELGRGDEDLVAMSTTIRPDKYSWNTKENLARLALFNNNELEDWYSIYQKALEGLAQAILDGILDNETILETIKAVQEGER